MGRRTLTVSWLLTLCFTVTLSSTSQAQTSVNAEYPSTRDAPSVKTPPKRRDFSGFEQAQRSAAISIIDSLVKESERYEDHALRVRVRARSADALWNVDETLARNLFLQAWVIAEKLDEASLESAEEAKKNALRSHGASVIMIPPSASLRSEVLGLAARRDPALGNILVARLDDPKKEGDESLDPGRSSSEYSDPTEPSMAVAQRLEVALELLNAGDVKQAKAFADPALGYATSPGIIFLCALRQKDSDAADKLYARLLARAASDQNAEATTVSLLSSYILTPNYLVTATRRGRVSNQFGDPVQSNNPPPALRSQFFSVAAAILVRPLRPTDQDLTVAGHAGTYFTIARLLPMFETYAPNYVPSLNNHLAMLALDAPETFRNGQDAMLRVGLFSEDSRGNTVTKILDEIGSTTTSAERDTLYVKAIREGTTKNDLRIRQFAGKIEDDNLRERAQAFADLAVIRNAISKKDTETALGIVRAGYLMPLHRVWATGEIVRLLRKTDSADVSQLLEDASADAHRIAIGDPDRVYALSCLATAFFAVDRFRSWSVAADVTKAANAVPGFTGEDPKLSVRLRSRNVIAMINADEPSFNIANLFELLAKDDLQLALSTANGLIGEHARAVTSLAVARSVLDKQKTPAVQK